MAIAALSRRMGLTIIATTRTESKVAAMGRRGRPRGARRRRDLRPGALDRAGGRARAVELVGTGTLPDTLRAVRVHGTVCFTGMLSDQCTVPDFYPIDYLPNGVRLTAYSGEAADLPADVLQTFLDDVAAGRTSVPVAGTYRFDDIVQAHRDLDAGAHSGKLVVLVGED
jgi:NADPH:quinone reductase-like Zn-dependent oxidoreductase